MSDVSLVLPNITLDFILGGKAEFKAVSPNGEAFWFRVSKGKVNPRYNATIPPFFVNVKDPANPNKVFGDWSYVGMLNGVEDRVGVVPTRKSTYTPNDKIVKVFNWIAGLLTDKKEFPAGYSVTNIGKCARCGRKLTDDVSRAHGFGPECSDILKLNHKRDEVKKLIEHGQAA